MDHVTKLVITIEMVQWSPFKRECDKELDDLLCKIRAKELLGHYGNVRTVIRSE